MMLHQALAERESSRKPVRVGLVGAGCMGRGIALQITAFTKGMRLIAIANRTLAKAVNNAALAGCEAPTIVENQATFDRTVLAGGTALTQDAGLVAKSPLVDVLVDATGSLEFAARIVVDAIDNGKHVVLMNAELDGTVGPALQRRANHAGLVCTNADGDQPGVIMNLYRFVRQIGLKPVLCGNIKGLLDRYRTPATQSAFAAQWGQEPKMVTSFADGTKLAFEQAIVANATGSRLLASGMLGPIVPPGTRIEDAASVFPVDTLLERGCVVDYVVGADPAPGVFVLATCNHPVQRDYLNLYKLGAGPLYCLHTPFHLCHFEVPFTIAKATLFGNAAVRPLAGIAVEVVATAKRDLPSGIRLDGIGGYDLYGRAEEAAHARALMLLPIGLSEDVVLRRSVRKDQLLRIDDVEIPPDRMVDALRAEQDAFFQSNWRDTALATECGALM